MNNSLERITITGLQGRKTVNVALRDNTLILVGENGSGKTTFLRILFYFLSGHWLSLVQFKFSSISATIGGVEYIISHEELVKSFRDTDRRLLADIPPSIRRQVLVHIENGDLERAASEVSRLGQRYSLPVEMFLRQMDFFDDRAKGARKDLQETIKRIREAVNAQVLYLPTYRRIERELGSIFEGVDQDDLRKSKGRLGRADDGASFVELVEFGMKDVQNAISNTLAQLKEFARENLTNLTLRYLGDVVNGDYQNVGMEFSQVSDETVSSVLDRIDDNILNKEHKDHIFRVINSARSSSTPSEHEKIIYHYFLKLLHFQESLQARERRISAFCEVCSEYIVDKRFVYDNAAFTFRIISTDEIGVEKEIDPGELSSGEKQIVSLFSHLYLTSHRRFFVLIDEPELSLSVPWQRRFLMDIAAGDFCAGLVAVTHSPFIYDNRLRSYTHSIGEFITK